MCIMFILEAKEREESTVTTKGRHRQGVGSYLAGLTHVFVPLLYCVKYVKLTAGCCAKNAMNEQLIGSY